MECCIYIYAHCEITLTMNSTKVQNPRHKMQVALLAEPKTLEYYEQ